MTFVCQLTYLTVYPRHSDQLIHMTVDIYTLQITLADRISFAIQNSLAPQLGSPSS